MDIMKNLKNPSVEYRPIPFWSLNDKLEPDVLTAQIQEMKKAGLGGYFMHARGGLKTEYMSDDWMNCIKACIDEGKKLGMNSWYYDENGWPSGFADGIIPGMGEEYHVKWLKLKEICPADVESVQSDLATLGIYSLELIENKISPLVLPAKKDVNIKYYSISCLSNPCYIDILNKDTIKAFIEVTHEKYYEQFKEDFGDGIMGFFTDEPQFSRGSVPWSHILPDEFQKRFGYDIIDYLPALFLECSGYEKIRYHFWSTVSELYVTSFGRQIYDWCQAHNCQLTGHVMMEDSLLGQMQATAGAMPFYEYMHIPGIDWLGRKIDSPVMPKQVSSAANQLGKKFVITETFALCGWNVSFEELKWIAEWQYVNGINLMCQHLEGYTLRGLRKRDYPPSLFYQQSWWNEYYQFNDYFARLGLLLSSGNSVAHVLLLHPIKSAWMAYSPIGYDMVSTLDKDFINISETLSNLHVDYHMGDETLIKKYGSVEGTAFKVGQCSYKTVILPSMISIDLNTLNLLENFIDNGGIVISAGLFPRLCEGEYDSRLADLFARALKPVSTDKIYDTLFEAGIPTISIYNKAGEISDIHYCERDLEDGKLYFLVNHSQQKTDADITIFTNGTVRKLSAESAELINIEQNCEKEGIHFKLSFEPMQSHILFIEKDQLSQGSSEKSNSNKTEILSLSPQWNIEKMGLNSLTLDYCYYSIDNAPWEGPIHTINLMDMLLKRRQECSASLKFDFNVDMDLTTLNELYLVVEDAGDFEINVNGKDIDYKDIGWWKDSSFKKVNIIDVIKHGENIIILSRKFYQAEKVYDVLFGENVLETERNKLTYDVELESIYIVGDFGTISTSEYTYGERNAAFTNGPFKITDKPVMLSSGNFTEQGLCFFSDTITISQKVNINKDGTRYILDLGKPMAPMTKVYVNDEAVKAVLWAPYQIDVTDHLKDGDNKVSITLFASNRNLLGPHHNIIGESYSVGPTTFTSKAGWSDRGLSQNIWTDRYCFVKFGL